MSLLIVGAGLAGYGLARALRRLDPERPIQLVTADDGDYYYKPALSAACAAGRSADQLLQKRGAAMAQELGIELVAGTRALGLDPKARVLRTDRADFPYRDLVLAHGARARTPPLTLGPGAVVHQVNHLSDYRQLRQALAGQRRVAIIGAGLIGCEFANDLALGGFQVTVLDPAPQPLGRLLPPEAAAALVQAMAAAGVDWRLGSQVQAVEAAGTAQRLLLADGGALEADAVLCAVGLVSAADWLEGAGIACRQGILVDSCLRTSAAGVYALGDCAEYPQGWLPFVAPIHAAARALAATLSGDPQPMALPPTPIKVKTPALPVSVLPAREAAQWRLEREEEGLAALARDTRGRLLGFALLGSACARQAALLEQLSLAEVS